MFKKTIVTLILINLLLVAYFYTRPFSFYKVIAIRPVKDFKDLINWDTINQDNFILNTISSLSEKNGTVFTHNQEKRKKLFLQGYGNCSNQSVAMGAILSDKNKRFQVVHLLPVYHFLEGSGHTVLQTTFKDSLILLDVIGRSFLKKENHFIDYKDLDSLAGLKSNNKITLEILNSNRSKTEKYFDPDSNKNIIIGIVPDIEYKKFYSFTKYLYTPSNETRITQVFFYSLTILFNKLPHIYVQERDFKKLSQNKKFKLDRFLSFALVINTWIIFSVLILYKFNKLYARIK